MITYNPLLCLDFYKTCHAEQYPKGLTKMVSYYTPRMSRQARRECKDTVEILEPLVQFLESDKGKNLLNLVREALGKTRKVEERMETRTYIPRVLEQEATT